MASEKEMLRTHATTWLTESHLRRLHRCAVQLHPAGVLVDHELEKVQGRITKLVGKQLTNREHMETF